MHKLVIFDLDGTLLNTIADLGDATNHAMAALGYPQHSPLSYPTMVGNGVARLIERALPDSARTPEIRERALEIFRAYYDEHLADNTVPYPGIPELLDELTARGIANIEGVPVKPDPSIVFRVLAEHPTPKAETLYVGDSGVDIETARRACVDSVGVTWGFRSAAELRAHYATHIITSPADLLPIAIEP